MNYSEIIIHENDNDQVKDLKRKILSLQAQLDIQRDRSNHLSGGSLIKTEAIDFYPGEQLDFVLSVLQQVQKKCAPDSRAYDIITSILSLNKPIGHGEEILLELNRIFKKGEPKTQADIADLRAIGFSYTQSRKHPKLRFHDKYMFVIPCTTSDSWRSSKNCLADISKCIPISMKI